MWFLVLALLFIVSYTEDEALHDSPHSEGVKNTPTASLQMGKSLR